MSRLETYSPVKTRNTCLKITFNQALAFVLPNGPSLKMKDTRSREPIFQGNNGERVGIVRSRGNRFHAGFPGSSGGDPLPRPICQPGSPPLPTFGQRKIRAFFLNSPNLSRPLLPDDARQNRSRANLSTPPVTHLSLSLSVSFILQGVNTRKNRGKSRKNYENLFQQIDEEVKL